MSNRWPGGLIRKTPVTPAGPLQNGAAPGMWTLAEASYWVKQGLWPTQGNVLAVEDVFSTYLYTGNGATQTITTGINLAGKGGMLWIKNRSTATNNIISDTVRGAGNFLMSNASSQQFFNTDNVSALSSTGFSVGVDSNTNGTAGNLYVSWTFREAPNFFDVVTYTGNGSTQNIAHNLGVAPGVIIVKSTTNTYSWGVYHRSYPNGYLFLNSTNAGDTANAQNMWGNNSTVVAPTSSQFTVGSFGTVNANGETYVAYLYAHVPASDGIIQCGSYTGNGSSSGPTVTLGWEPQWMLMKRAGGTGQWFLIDNMRGMALTGNGNSLYPNTSEYENQYWAANFATINATGFQVVNSDVEINASGSQYIYVAIRRGPMRTPTLGTSVFYPVAYSGTGATNALTGFGFPPDLSMISGRSSNLGAVLDRLRGPNRLLQTRGDQAESAPSNELMSFDQNGVTLGSNSSGGWTNVSSTNYVTWEFRRAPGFFDEVCFTATSGLLNISHNLGVAPELVIVKTRGTTGNWLTLYSAGAGMVFYLDLNWQANNGFTPKDNFTSNGSTYTAPTANSLFFNNLTSATQVAYLFASAPGVSKVGSYTGNGSSQTINCAFTTGARYVLIKRTDSTGDWYVWDSARGIVAGNDPYLALNSTAAEVTSNDSVDTDSTGFVVNQVAASNINVSAATYIFLAIA